MLNAAADRVKDFFDQCVPWGSGVDPMGNKSHAGERQCEQLRNKLSEATLQVEKAPEDVSTRTRGPRGGRGRGRAGGSAPAPAPAPVPPLLKREADEAGLDELLPPIPPLPKRRAADKELIEKLQQEVENLKKAPPPPPPAAGPPAPPLAEQLTMGTPGAEPLTMADRLLLAEVCELVCALACSCAC